MRSHTAVLTFQESNHQQLYFWHKKSYFCIRYFIPENAYCVIIYIFAYTQTILTHPHSIIKRHTCSLDFVFVKFVVFVVYNFHCSERKRHLRPVVFLKLKVLLIVHLCKVVGQVIQRKLGHHGKLMILHFSNSSVNCLSLLYLSLEQIPKIISKYRNCYKYRLYI